jgi:dimethylamine---corrinoid protein Co-methyltransferase
MMVDGIETRMGDGELVSISADALREDIQAGIKDAAEKGGIPELTAEEADKLFDIFSDPSNMVSVCPGEEVISTDDGCIMAFYSGPDSAAVGVPLSRLQAILTYERACAGDTICMGHSDFSIKPAKPVINFELNEYYQASTMATAPLFYGAQPNMGLYFRPDGPYENPADLLPRGKIAEARKAQEEASQHLTDDIVFIGKKLNEIGCEGVNLDTVGSAGDADFLAALKGAEILKKEAPNMSVIIGMAGEFVLGMHGEITYGGRRLAGLYPHEQVKVVEAAGADIFGMAVNISTGASTPWNVARAVTFCKATVAAAEIPVHANVGMGVGGIPMMEAPAIDAVTRASKALVQIGKADGL